MKAGCCRAAAMLTHLVLLVVGRTGAFQLHTGSSTVSSRGPLLTGSTSSCRFRAGTLPVSRRTASASASSSSLMERLDAASDDGTWRSFLRRGGVACLTLTLSLLLSSSGAARAEQWDSAAATALAANMGRSSASSGNTALPPPPKKLGYWDAVRDGSGSVVTEANERLLDYAVGTINTMYYDNTGGFRFYNADLYDRWKALKCYNKGGDDKDAMMAQADLTKEELKTMPRDVFDSWEGAVTGIKWLVSTLNDPYSKFLTRDELREELGFNLQKKDGFLGLGAIVEVPSKQQRKYTPPKKAGAKPAPYVTGTSIQYDVGNIDVQSMIDSDNNKAATSSAASASSLSSASTNMGSNKKQKLQSGKLNTNMNKPSTVNKRSTPTPPTNTGSFTNNNNYNNLITATRADNLPVVVAVAPDSPAERSGLVVGDRIAAVGVDRFLGMAREEVSAVLDKKYNADNYAGYPDITVAKPVMTQALVNFDADDDPFVIQRPQLVGYRLSRVRLPTTSVEPFRLYTPVTSGSGSTASSADSSSGGDVTAQSNGNGKPTSDASTPLLSGGNSVCHYELLTPNDSIFNSFLSTTTTNDDKKFTSRSSSASSTSNTKNLVGYIRLTRFSRASTVGYFDAVNALEQAGASSYIIDLRNNYGGVIQESMLTAATLLRDPSTVLCYTLNSRGGFTPHDLEEYIVDNRYPGYLLSTESPGVSLSLVRKNNPNIFRDNGEWKPPSQFASLHEQGVKRGKPAPTTAYNDPAASILRKQKKIVLLINEGTASSAEVFVSSLHDNGRAVALVGAKTYGKGLIQHTFPMPDGGGLRLTVAEYLTPALQHVTKVGMAQYEAATGELVGGGVQPDIYCESRGIPSNPGADICVGIALDTIAEADAKEEQEMMKPKTKNGKVKSSKDIVAGRTGGSGSDGAGKRRVVTAGVLKDDF